MNNKDYKEFINDVCDFMTRTANFKEEINKRGVCDHEKIGFVHGIRWCVSCIKSNFNLLEGVNKNENE